MAEERSAAERAIDLGKANEVSLTGAAEPLASPGHFPPALLTLSENIMLPYYPSKKTTGAIVEFFKQSRRLVNQQWNLRDQFRAVDLAYLREQDMTSEQWKAQNANKKGDPTKFQNITVPVVMPQVESAVTYQQSVFLSGFPIFGVTSPPEHADAATQMDTIIGEQQIHANWVPEILKALRNGFKYNLGPVEVDWTRHTTYALEDSTAQAGGDVIDRQKEVIWEGNSITALDPYNTFFDTRVKPTEVCKEGEFAGYTQLMSRIRLKKYLSELPARINVKKAFESGSTGVPAGAFSGEESYYIPQLNPNALYENSGFATTDWMAWAGMASTNDPRIAYRNLYEVTVLYGRILPEDFDMTNVPSKNTPQVWKFILVNGQVLVYAERLTNVHNLLPILFCVPVDDGLGYQSKSFAKNLDDTQAISSALANSLIATRRRAVADRMVYDPSRVSEASIRSDSPVARIPVRPSAYGTSMADAVHVLPFRDDQSGVTLQAMQQFGVMSNAISGLNPARQGQFVKGNKTRAEFEEIMGYANGRDQTVALALEGNFFAPMKEIIKCNILQYQGGVSLFNREEQREVVVDPVVLRKAKLGFKISDGLLPSDKLIDGESLAMAFQTLQASPELAAGFNLTPMFSYLMKTRGAKLQPFEKSPQQQAYEQAMAVWQQTVAAIAEQFGTRQPPVSPEEFQQMLPPRPLPEEYGYNPETPNVSLEADGVTVAGRYAQVNQEQQQALQNAQAASQQAGQMPAAQEGDE